MTGVSPMMQQYLSIKESNPESILLFRLGDFYEMFFDDAKTCSEELDLVLTGKDCGLEQRAPMCGIPYHSCESYIARLIQKGYKVAICEQMEDPATAKGLVKREVVRVITPGTVIEDSMLEEGKNNYLCGIAFGEKSAGVCFVDVSTGEVHLTTLAGEELENRLISELGRFLPSEVLLSQSYRLYPKLEQFLTQTLNCRISVLADEKFLAAGKGEFVVRQFNTLSVEQLGLSANSCETAALDAVLQYLSENGMSKLSGLQKIDRYTSSKYMNIDLSSMRNLELIETMRGKTKRGSLLWVLDKTKTAMGKRLLRSWLEQPLLSMQSILQRQNAVDELASDAVLLGEATEYLTGMRDVERLMTRVVYGTANPKEVQELSRTMSRFAPLKQLLSTAHSKLLQSLFQSMDPLTDQCELIENTLAENPPIGMKDGNIIRPGFSSEVDSVRADMNGGKDFITRLELHEKERTGIKNLKVRYNKVFGYYIEVPLSAANSVPEDYVRKQTLTNAERYITDELKNFEARFLGARERDIQLEFELFCSLRNQIANNLQRIQQTAAAVGQLDSLCSFATVAIANNYCCPRMNTDGVLNINAGRHPVVERVSKIPFVANDTVLDQKENRCAIITGPNMAGKSTYMRQVAIITIMAQIGSFVPAQSANIPITDAVFTRVGASDDLATGQSTFMVEMNEVAYILKNATPNSLLILDEIGRGTSTFDGMAIARAVLEHVADTKKLGAKTLFATHYHELTALENELKGVKNYNIAVKKHGDDITFLRRIVRGGADESYGVEVAKLAGLPSGVIRRAKAILKELEETGVTREVKVVQQPVQLPLGVGEYNGIIEELKALDVNVLTPIEALGILNDIAGRAKKI